MDDRRFDALARSLAAGCSRRDALKGMLGLGGAVIAGAMVHDQADAARRGYSGPPIPTSCTPQCDGTTCGSNGCGGTCACSRSLPICVLDSGLCFKYCDTELGCATGCLCDEAFNGCISEQTFGSDCSLASDCPSGTFCYDDGTCRAPCV